jgi:hypothetical protein
MQKTTRWFYGRMLAAAVLLTPGALTACGSGDEAGDGSGGPTVAVLSPADGAQVNPPFTVKIKASVPLGPTDSGKHHVHVYFDDHADDYTIVESDSGEILNAPPGEHTLHVSLRNANHSPAGAEAAVKVNVGAGETTEPDAGPNGY